MGCQDDVQGHQSVVCSPPKLSKAVKSQTRAKPLCVHVVENHDIGDERKGKTVRGSEEDWALCMINWEQERKHGHAREATTIEGKQEFLKTNNQKEFYPASQMLPIVQTREHLGNIYLISFLISHHTVCSLSTSTRENSLSLSKALKATWVRTGKYFSNFILPSPSLIDTH